MIGCPLQTFVVVVAFSNVLCSAILIASILLESTVEISPKAFLDNGYACGAPITCKCIWGSVHKTRIADVIVFITWRYITEQAPSSYSDQMLKKKQHDLFLIPTELKQSKLLDSKYRWRWQQKQNFARDPFSVSKQLITNK